MALDSALSGSPFSNLQEFETATDAGEAILAQALVLAQRAWGERLVAAYALGSLAHGGFSVHVSDVDFGVMLDDPLQDSDAKTAGALSAAVKAGGAPLAERLSLFWGSPATIGGRAQGGRFPPVDLLDLKTHGRLLDGREVRDAARTPSTAEMVVAAARQALKTLVSDASTAQLRDPVELVAAGARSLTKRVLFPVRFLYTARTGLIGRNDAAVAYFLQTESGPAAGLAGEAFLWRYRPFEPGDPWVRGMAARGLLPLYRLFVDDYGRRLRSLGEDELARAFEAWHARLS